MNQTLEIRKTPGGKVFARRRDGVPLTPEDREKAKWLAGEVAGLPRAWVVEEIQDGESVKAVKICSALLDDHLWVILDRSFAPKDGLAFYYAEEIPLLGDKTLEELRQIHKVKLAFPGARVIQEGAEDKRERRR